MKARVGVGQIQLGLRTHENFGWEQVWWGIFEDTLAEVQHSPVYVKSGWGRGVGLGQVAAPAHEG